MNKGTYIPITTVTLNPALDHTLPFATFEIGQLNRVHTERLDPGGKGINVAKVIRALGHETAVTGFLGTDNAAVFKNYFQAAGIEDHFVDVAGSTRVNIKIVEDSGQLTEINFPGIACTAADLAKLTAKLDVLAARQGVVILAGSLPQGVPADIFAQYVKRLKDAGCKVFLDTSEQALAAGIKAQPYAIKPNLRELSQLTGRALDTEADINRVIDELLAGGLEEVTVSLGERGALIGTKTERFIAVPPKVQAKSTVGAGDAMVAGLTIGHMLELSTAERIRLATATAVASVIRPGTQACSMADVEQVIPQVAIKACD